MVTVVQASTENGLEDTEVAHKQPKDTHQELVSDLVQQARSEGMDLVGENGLLGRLTKLVLESALEGEITDHLGYDKHERSTGSDSGNARNGTRSKTVITDVGPVEISVPRDRDGGFDPKIVRKRQRRLSGVDEMVISPAAKGLTTGEIPAHLAEVYGADVSRRTISAITDKVLDGMAEWQNRPLDPVYPVIFIDAIHVKLRRESQVANRPIYVTLAVTVDEERYILGLWAGDGGEGRTQVRLHGDHEPGPDRQGPQTLDHPLASRPERLRHHLRRPPYPDHPLKQVTQSYTVYWTDLPLVASEGGRHGI